MRNHHIRRVRAGDRRALLVLWERSVRATHDFLTEADIDFYRPLVADILAAERIELWILVDGQATPIGFLGVSEHVVEALFVDPDRLGAGWGRRLVAHAQALQLGDQAVDVNEQNIAARRFYAALGFIVVGRSEHDDAGRPHPVLHLRRSAGEPDIDVTSAPGIF
jgi:putative acetyltransferase